MKLIRRESYLKKLLNLRLTPDVKVITGVRRSGKTKLLQDYTNILNEIDNLANIIFIDFNDLENEKYKSYKKLNNYVNKMFIEGKHNYLFIDEVQMCKKFELVVNSLHNSGKFDIYITGSNAFLLSSDLATLFTGRTMSIEVYPFSFNEYSMYIDDEDLRINKLLDQYIEFGGFSGSYVYNDLKNKVEYIKKVFITIIQRDLLEKYKIQDRELLNNIAYYLMDNISNLTTANNITNYLTSKKYATSNKTVSNYIEYLCNSFLFYKVKRYDLKGKKLLETIDKYYLVDHSIRYAFLSSGKLDYGRLYENIVLIELLRRGYDVTIGKLYSTEIDFIAKKDLDLIYIQVSSNIKNDDTFDREITPLLKITNATEKLLIARTYEKVRIYEGIKIIDLAEWLIK